MKLTCKAIAEKVLASYPYISSCKLIRDPRGYFYAVGAFASDDRAFVTGGIYTYRLDNGWSLQQWTEEVENVVREEF